MVMRGFFDNVFYGGGGGMIQIEYKRDIIGPLDKRHLTNKDIWKTSELAASKRSADSRWGVNQLATFPNFFKML